MLFRKIYVQVALGMLLLAAVLTGYLLWESQCQSIDSVAEYEWERTERDYRQFRLKLQGLGKRMELEKNTTLRRSIAVSTFRSIFLSRGALFENGKEVYNASEYTYDPALLQPPSFGMSYMPQDAEKSEVYSVNDRRLLLFSEGDASFGGQEYGVILYKDVTDIYTRTRDIFWKGLCVTALVLLLLGALLYRGISRLLCPLFDLKKTAAAIAGGAYESRAAASGRDEIAELTKSFNQMAEKVEEHLALLADTNEKQRQLLGSLAHELKTPLTAIIGYADTLLTTRLSPENSERALRYIGSEGRRLSRLSEKLLELTGLYETDESSLAMRPVRLAELLERLRELTSFLLERKKLCLVISCTPKELVRELDEDLIMSLLMNLVDNGVKASAEGGQLRVSALVDRITVEDFGKGIPREELSQVMQPFYMGNKARAKTAGSVGLGLALCRRIAELHGAALEIESMEGEGTRVSIVWERG